MQKAADRAEFAGAEVKALALAAVRATHEVEAREAGEALACIAGTPLPGEKLDGQLFNGREEIALFPGDLPSAVNGRITVPEDGVGVRFLRFRPPVPRATGFGSDPVLPHIRLDRAIEFLIGDRLE